jgi:hypothetical protein
VDDWLVPAGCNTPVKLRKAVNTLQVSIMSLQDKTNVKESGTGECVTISSCLYSKVRLKAANDVAMSVKIAQKA